MFAVVFSGGEEEFQGEAAVHTRRLLASSARHGHGSNPWRKGQKVGAFHSSCHF
jgi:hypothetical protein